MRFCEMPGCVGTMSPEAKLAEALGKAEVFSAMTLAFSLLMSNLCGRLSGLPYS